MSNIRLAPLAGVTDWTFRVLCFEQGCQAACTEMVSAKGWVMNPHQEATNQLLIHHPNEGPLTLQLFGKQPEMMAKAAEALSASGRFQGIDINMGCPAGKVACSGEGSGLLRTPQLASEVMEAVVKASSLPVSVKFRLGWDESSINILEMAKRAEDAGVAQITIHGRTRRQQYSGTADWQWIPKVKQIVRIPVIGNGDILTAQEGVRRLKESGADGIMIARGAMGNPWIFRQINDLLNGEPVQPVSSEEWLAVIRRHYGMLTEWKGERLAIREMRKHVAWYLHGLRGAAKMRVRINAMTTLQEIDQALEEFSLNGDANE